MKSKLRELHTALKDADVLPDTQQDILFLLDGSASIDEYRAKIIQWSTEYLSATFAKGPAKIGKIDVPPDVANKILRNLDNRQYRQLSRAEIQQILVNPARTVRDLYDVAMNLHDSSSGIQPRELHVSDLVAISLGELENKVLGGKRTDALFVGTFILIGIIVVRLFDYVLKNTAHEYPIISATITTILVPAIMGLTIYVADTEGGSNNTKSHVGGGVPAYEICVVVLVVVLMLLCMLCLWAGGCLTYPARHNPYCPYIKYNGGTVI